MCKNLRSWNARFLCQRNCRVRNAVFEKSWRTQGENPRGLPVRFCCHLVLFLCAIPSRLRFLAGVPPVFFVCRFLWGLSFSRLPQAWCAPVGSGRVPSRRPLPRAIPEGPGVCSAVPHTPLTPKIPDKVHPRGCRTSLKTSIQRKSAELADLSVSFPAPAVERPWELSNKPKGTWGFDGGSQSKMWKDFFAFQSRSGASAVSKLPPTECPARSPFASSLVPSRAGLQCLFQCLSRLPNALESVV